MFLSSLSQMRCWMIFLRKLVYTPQYLDATTLPLHSCVIALSNKTTSLFLNSSTRMKSVLSRKACLVTPFLNPLIKNCQKAYHPSCEWSSDESMIGFKDRLSFIQYLLKKPTKWRMKAFGLRQTTGIDTN